MDELNFNVDEGDTGVLGTIAAQFELEIAELQAKVAELQVRLKDTQQLQRFVAEGAGRLAAGHKAETLRQLTTGDRHLRLLAKHNAEAADEVETLKRELQTAVAQRFTDLPAQLPEALERVGLTLDPGSRHPSYSILEGLIEIKFNKTKLEARVLPRDGRRTAFPIDLDLLANHLRAEADRLTGRPFDPTAFLAYISNAYQSVKGTLRSGADSVPLKDLVAELSKSETFQADEFNVDLSRLVRDEVSAGRIRLDNTRDAKNGLLLWQLEQRGYYGYMRMENED